MKLLSSEKRKIINKKSISFVSCLYTTQGNERALNLTLQSLKHLKFTRLGNGVS